MALVYLWGAGLDQHQHRWIPKPRGPGSSEGRSPASQVLRPAAHLRERSCAREPLTSRLLAGAGSEGQRGFAVWASAKDAPLQRGP